MEKYPLVELDKCSFGDSYYVKGDYQCSAALLQRASIEQECKEFDIPLAAINISDLAFTIDNTLHFINHMVRVNNTNLDYPIILTPLGEICDGYHRVCKAIIENKETIKAVRLKHLP